MKPHDTPSHDTRTPESSYESPQITDLSDGTTPLVTTPGAGPIPSGTE